MMARASKATQRPLPSTGKASIDTVQGPTSEGSGGEILPLDRDPETARSPLITVRALQPSRWRIGLHFTPEPRTLVETLSEADLASLLADPLLSVSVAVDD
jgi:hypothetical protein